MKHYRPERVDKSWHKLTYPCKPSNTRYLELELSITQLLYCLLN